MKLSKWLLLPALALPLASTFTSGTPTYASDVNGHDDLKNMVFQALHAKNEAFIDGKTDHFGQYMNSVTQNKYQEQVNQGLSSLESAGLSYTKESTGLTFDDIKVDGNKAELHVSELRKFYLHNKKNDDGSTPEFAAEKISHLIKLTLQDNKWILSEDQQLSGFTSASPVQACSPSPQKLNRPR